jgi:apolipoprotein D and lipocalin family protein
LKLFVSEDWYFVAGNKKTISLILSLALLFYLSSSLIDIDQVFTFIEGFFLTTIIKHLFLIAPFLMCCFLFSKEVASQENNASALKAIESLDVTRYLGNWYEIAKFPNWFQKKCKTDTKANYSFKNDGNLAVFNQCRLENGQISEAIGTAKQIGDARSAKLRVRFAPEWLSLIPFVWGDYWVIDIDTTYQLVAISEPKREYLWILSRAPEPDDKQLNDLLLRLSANGFDLSKLERTPHKEVIYSK